MFRIINPNQLAEKFPRPPHKCPNNKILYRVTFRYKSNLSSQHLYDVTSENFDFDINDTGGKIKPGKIVKYKSSKKNDPNNNQPARIVKSTSVYKGTAALRRGLPAIPSSDITEYDIKFLNPITVNNKVITDKKGVKKNELSLIPQLEGFICQDPPVNIMIINNYIQARNAYKNNKTAPLRTALQTAENNLWDNGNFVLNDNNEPRYPRWQDQGQPLWNTQQALQKKLNQATENMVKMSFLPNKSDNKPKIIGGKNNWSLKFTMPEGSKPGDIITITAGNQNVTVKIPLKLAYNTVPEPNNQLTERITRDLNKSSYDNFKKTKTKNGPNLNFKPTFIKALQANGKQSDLNKMVKPSTNQIFEITNAKIMEQSDRNNFKFKELDTFDKNISNLVYDLEVDVYLTLKKETIKTKKEKEELSKAPLHKQFVRGFMGGVDNLINNMGTRFDCPDKMNHFRTSMGILKTKLMPEKTRTTTKTRFSTSPSTG